MKATPVLVGLAILCLASAVPARADQRFSATLTGGQQFPAVASAGTGVGTVVLNTAETQITVNMSFTGLSSAANAAHIHGPAAAGANAGILFIFGAVPMLTVAKGGNGTSSAFVGSTPTGILCGGDCAEAYDSGTSVTLFAGNGSPGSVFAGWIGGGCMGTAECVVTLTVNALVTAVYSLVGSAFSFIDDPLSVGQTAVKAAHIVALQNAVATLRANNQLTSFVFTDAPLAAGTTVKAVHIAELRTAIDAVFIKRGCAVITYTDPTIMTAVTPIKAVHVSELRMAVRLIE